MPSSRAHCTYTNSRITVIHSLSPAVYSCARNPPPPPPPPPRPRVHSATKLLSLHHSVGQHSGGRKSVQGLKPDRSSQRGGDRPIPSIERDHRRPRRKRRGKFLFYPMPTPSTAVLPFSARLCPRSPPSVAPCSSRLDTSRTRHRVTARFLLLHHSFLSFAFFHQKSPKFQERKFLLSLSFFPLLAESRGRGREERSREGKTFLLNEKKKKKKEESHGHTTLRRESLRIPGTVFFPCPPLHVLRTAERTRGGR